MSDIPSMGGVVHPDGSVSMGSDARLFVQFFAYSEHQPFRSQVEGRPVYEKKDYIRIIQPGERDKLEREVQESDKFRFPRQWEAYQRAQEQVPDGTPISVLYPQDPQICDMMRALSIHTIEQLAGLTEQGIARLGMGARAHVERAKSFLSAAGGMRGAHDLQRKLDEAQDKIASLEATMEQLRADMAQNGRRRRQEQQET